MAPPQGCSVGRPQAPAQPQLPSAWRRRKAVQLRRDLVGPTAKRTGTLADLAPAPQPKRARACGHPTMYLPPDASGFTDSLRIWTKG
eukprot:6421782-Lingulodinium_polyedra.AAC.1